MISEMPMRVVFLWNQPAKDFVCCILTIKFHHGNYNDFYTHNLLMKTFRSEKKQGIVICLESYKISSCYI